MITNIIKQSSRGYDRISAEDVLFNRRIINLKGEIKSESCDEIITKILALEATAPGKNITIIIDSPGGAVSSGLGVYDCIRSISSPVTTAIIGSAASMAAIIFLAGDKRVMAQNASFMIHDPSYGKRDISGMKPFEIREDLDRLNKTRERTGRIIAARTGRSLDEVFENTKNDDPMTAKEALDFGAATEIGLESIINEMCSHENVI